MQETNKKGNKEQKARSSYDTALYHALYFIFLWYVFSILSFIQYLSHPSFTQALWNGDIKYHIMPILQLPWRLRW